MTQIVIIRRNGTTAQPNPNPKREWTEQEGLGMNALDIAFLAIIGISGLLSLRLGLIRECFALGAMLIGLLAVAVLGQTIGSNLPNWLSNEVASQLIFLLISFLVLYLLIIVLGSVVAKQVRSVKMRLVDYLLLVLFGMIRGVLIVILVTAGLTMVMPEGNEIMVTSRIYHLQHNPLTTLAKLFPPEAEEAFSDRHRQFRLSSVPFRFLDKPTYREVPNPADDRGRGGNDEPAGDSDDPVIPPPAEGEVIDL